jgi:hypothetical protein
MFGVGLYNHRIGAVVGRFIAQRRERIAEIARRVIAAMARRPGSSPEAITAAVWGSLFGISLQKLIDPEFDSDAALDALAEMTFALAAAPETLPQEAR